MPLKTPTQRFTWGLLAGFLAIAGLWLLVLIGQAGRPVPNTQWVSQAYAHKLGLASAVGQPKLLVVGGSATMFGVDSRIMAEALGRPVVNLGVNAGILTPFIHHYARQAIKPGDWVLLPVEYPLFHGRYSINLPFIDYWWEHPGFRRVNVNSAQLAQLLWLTPVSRAVDGYRGLPPNFAVSGLYGPQNLDGNGDQANSEADQQQIWMRELVERSVVEQYGAKAHAWNANWESWKALADEITAMGGCAIFVPPPMLDRVDYHMGKEHQYYVTLPEQARMQGLNYVGSPLDTLYPIDWFFDTNYHLNATARSVYTQYLIKKIKPVFASCRR